jgi:AraC-like DNA-binding protein
MADELNINYSAFRKAFKKYTGLSPMQYHTALRMKQALYLLANSDLSIKEISFNLGFCSIFYFSKLFKEKTGMTPGAYRRKIENTGLIIFKNMQNKFPEQEELENSKLLFH